MAPPSGNRLRRTSFSAGISAAWSGLGLGVRTSELRRTYLQLVLASLVVVLAIDVGGVWAIWHATATTADTMWYWDVLRWVLRVAGILLVLVAAPLLALSVVNVVFPFLAERVFIAALRQRAPARADQLAAMPGLSFGASTGAGLRRMGRFLVLGVLALVVSFVPVVGQVVGPGLQIYNGARGMAWELLEPYFDRAGMRYADQKATIAAHRSALVGFGLPMTLLMAIPIVGSVLFGLAQAAAAVLVVDVLEAPGSKPA